MNIWTCKIGEHDPLDEHQPADPPMRDAVERAYREITGQEPDFIFSGWGGELTEAERAVVEDRLPAPPTLGDIAALLDKSLKPDAAVQWLEARIEKWGTDEGPYELYAEASALTEGVFS